MTQSASIPAQATARRTAVIAPAANGITKTKMSDVVEQAMHPMLQEALEARDAAHQIEMRKLEDRMQEQIDGLQENVDNANSCFEELDSELRKLLREDTDGKPVAISWAELLKTADHSVSRSHNEWDVFYPLRQVLERVQPEVDIRTVTIEKVVIREPDGLINDIKSAVGLLKKWTEAD